MFLGVFLILAFLVLLTKIYTTIGGIVIVFDFTHNVLTEIIGVRSEIVVGTAFFFITIFFSIFLGLFFLLCLLRFFLFFLIFWLLYFSLIISVIHSFLSFDNLLRSLLYFFSQLLLNLIIFYNFSF